MVEGPYHTERSEILCSMAAVSVKTLKAEPV